MIDFYLCRHGRTPLNVAGRLRGHLDPELDLVGLTEARDLANLLAPLEVTRVVSSPLRRAQQTAAPIATAADLSVDLDGRFVDRSYGEFDGALAADVIATYGRVSAAPGVESTTSVFERARAALMELAEGSSAGPVVVVTHDAVIRALVENLDPGLAPAGLVPRRTGSWNLIRYENNSWKLIRLDSKDDPIETLATS